jgi:hypothetical protein
VTSLCLAAVLRAPLGDPAAAQRAVPRQAARLLADTPRCTPQLLVLTALRLSLRIYLTHSLELEPLPTELSFEKGLFVVVRAIQLLAAAQPGRVRPSRALTPPHKRRPNNACALQLIVVGLAGPSGAGKTELSRRLHELTPLAVLSLGASFVMHFRLLSSLIAPRCSVLQTRI